VTIAEQRRQTSGGRGAIAGHRRLDLQGMRAVAVFTVFANHLFDWPPGGFVGVDVFLVLNGFFITGILIRERTTFGYKGDDATRIALVGDSHATLLISALRQILSANKWRLTTYTGHECAFMNPAPDGCRETMARTEAELLAHPYDLVLFAKYNATQNALAYQSAWSPIAAAGSRIAVLVDNPESSKEAGACVTRVSLGGDRTGECGTPRAEAFRHPMDWSPPPNSFPAQR
jgi:hypothetical protein